MSVNDRIATSSDRAVAEGPVPGGRSPRAAPNVLRLVVLRELRTRGLSGSYIISSAVTLLIVLGLIIVPTIFGDSTTTYRLGLVGDGNQPIIDSATALANARSTDSDAQTTFETRAFEDIAAAETAVEEGELEAVLVDGEELVMATTGGLGGSDVQDLLQQAAGTRQVESLVGEERAPEVVDALTTDPLQVRALSGQDAQENEGRAWIAYGGLVLTYMIILGYAVWTLNGVTEEKSNRVIELLLAAAKPWELLAGKILGISLLGLGQFLVTITAALIAIRVTGAFDLPVVPVDMVATLVLWVVLGFGIYMVLSGAAGALASKPEDAQNAMTPISMMAVGSFFLSFAVLDSPDGLAATIGTFVPFTAPFVIPIRAAFQVLPLWQHLLAIAIALVTTGILLRVGGRVYSGGALQFGGRLKWREAFRSAEL
jgi:ABC-2 type transport system permease protein